MPQKKNKGKFKEGGAFSRAEILSRMLDMSEEQTQLRAASVKYQVLKKILTDIVADFPPHTRLPGIRDISTCMGTSLVTTQRAVTEMLNENVLYSKPRSGVFVSDRTAPEETRTPGAAPANDHPFRVVFDFATDSAAPHQRKFWEELAALFSKQYPNVTPVVHFTSDIATLGKNFDAWERYDWNRSRYGSLDEVLDIADFAGPLLGTPSTGGRHLPLYHRTYFTFYNETLLARHRLPVPDYRTFDAQTNYLREIGPKLERLGFNPKPYSTQEPATLFGGRITDFCNAVVSGSISPQTRQELVSIIERLVAYCQLFRYSLKDRDDWQQARQEFARGQSPFFVGYSVDYWELSQRKLPFSLKACPTLRCDDTFFLWPRIGQVASRSEHPMESMHFLLFLLRDDVQRRFAGTGNFGANLTRDFYPRTTASPEWIKDVLPRSKPFHFPNAEGYYMAVNVLGGEIWRALVGNVAPAETLERALLMGRSYLKHRPSESARKAAGERAPAA